VGGKLFFSNAYHGTHYFHHSSIKYHTNTNE
jgi:hypothetical protein